jgi:hypothetical protein
MCFDIVLHMGKTGLTTAKDTLNRARNDLFISTDSFFNMKLNLQEALRQLRATADL